MWAPSRECLSQAALGRARQGAGARPQSGNPATSSPSPYPILHCRAPLILHHTPLSYHTHLAEKEEGGPMCDPGIRVQLLYPLQPIPHKSRWKGEDLNNH